MKKNPLSNKLSEGYQENDILLAINKSGYPLQTTILRKLRKNYQISEEWDFKDSDSDVMKNIDMLAVKPLHQFDGKTRVRANLNLLIECKQSSDPFVFFLSDNNPYIPKFPVISGLNNDEISISTDDSLSTWAFPVLKLLDLDQHSFLLQEVEYCYTFSQCHKKNQKIELSKSNALSELVNHTQKAINYLKEIEKPKSTARYFDSQLCLGIIVLDAPMIGVTIDPSLEKNINFIPWIRVLKHDNELSDNHHHHRISVTDVVHKDYFEKYIEKHLEPFANKFAEKVLKNDLVLSSGKGFISGMDKNCFTNLESRLKPKPLLVNKKWKNIFNRD